MIVVLMCLLLTFIVYLPSGFLEIGKAIKTIPYRLNFSNRKKNSQSKNFLPVV